MLAQVGMLGAASGEAGSVGPGPTGPPTNVSTYNAGDEGDPRTGVQWTNGDVTAQTQTGFSTDSGTDPTGPWLASAPGVTSQDTTDSTTGRWWWARHVKNGQVTAWVLGGEGFGS